MRTLKQTEILEEYLSGLQPEQAQVWRELALYLAGLGYDLKRQRANLVFACPLHRKQIAKIGFDKAGEPLFALRFSACRGYSPRFAEIVRHAVDKEKYREASCLQEECYCKGPASQRVYMYEFPNGEKRYHCGAVALAIPGLNAADLPEVKALMEEEHRFLMKYEAEASV
ncbi:MAG: hypothetical protein K2P33_07845 [Acutalibacter sp.]|nr:hypothetical protein [Acutalibacter sp.]